MKRLHKAKYFISGMIVMAVVFAIVMSVSADFIFPAGAVESPYNTPTNFKRNIQISYDDYKIYVDGKQFEARDSNGVIMPFAFDGWIYAPFEKIAEALGQKVRWDGSTNSLYNNIARRRRNPEREYKRKKMAYGTDACCIEIL
jgi:hypothetical protein